MVGSRLHLDDLLDGIYLQDLVALERFIDNLQENGQQAPAQANHGPYRKIDSSRYDDEGHTDSQNTVHGNAAEKVFNVATLQKGLRHGDGQDHPKHH